MMVLSTALLVLLIVVGALNDPIHPPESGIYPEEDLQLYFEQFKIKFDRQYSGSIEEAQRFELFKKNVREINRLNQKSAGTPIYRINQFTDQTPEEKKRFKGFKELRVNEVTERWMGDNITYEYGDQENFDWRDKGVVTRVKFQGSKCGSCWAFSAIGSIESQYAIKYNVVPPIELSEQQLVDCDMYDFGCGGGYPSNAYMAIKEYGGINTERDYPYLAKDDYCRVMKNNLKVTTAGTLEIARDEEAIRKALIKYGPVSVGMASGDVSVEHYHGGGILRAEDCPSREIDHALLVVGYGVKDGVKYWVIKNSWSNSWGDNGYLYLERGKNACGINSEAVVPIVVGL